MADKIQIYAGKKDTMPQLLPREFGYCTDSHELYIGTVYEGNKLIGAVAWGTDISTLKTSLETLSDTLGEKLSASKAVSVADVETDATTATLITAFNTLLSSLKDAGIMET